MPIQGILHWSNCGHQYSARAEFVTATKNELRFSLYRGGPPSYHIDQIVGISRRMTSYNYFEPDNPERFAAAVEGCDIDRDNEREWRRKRLIARAEKLEMEARDLEVANAPYRGDVAFNTQPGHIPERARAIRRTEKAGALMRQARALRERAANIR